MIVFWTGWGILALFVPILCFAGVLVGACLSGAWVGDWDEEPVLIGSAWMLSGLLCWILGRLLNRRKPGTSPHTFLFMEMQWMGVVYGLAGLWFYGKALLARFG